MSKFYKVSLIVAAAFFGVGILLGVIGSFGKKPAEERAKLERNSVTVLSKIKGLYFSQSANNSVIADEILNEIEDEFGIDLDLDDDLEDDVDEDASGESGESKWKAASEVNSYDADEVEKLSLELGAGYFYIEGKDASADHSIEILLEGKGKVKSSLKNGKLTVEGLKYQGNITGRFTKNSGKLIIRIPKDKKLEEIDLEGGAGEFRLSQVVADRMEIELGAGSMNADEVTCGEAKISVGMGNFSYNGEITGNAKLDCGMGNVKLKLSGKEEDHNYNIDCAAGNVAIGGNSLSALASERTIDNQADHTFDIDCGMGNVKIEFTN